MTFFVIGDEDVIIGFRFIGINGKVVETSDVALNEFNKIIAGDYGEIGILLITEKISILIEKEIIQWQLEGSYPMIVEIPDMDGHFEEKKTMLESIKNAIGLPV